MATPRREPDRDAQRSRIVDAALALFGSRGFDAVTMAEVAAQAGVARATVFNHFGSKHALVEAIIERVLDYWAGMLERALADEKTSTPTLVRALFDHMGFDPVGIARYAREHLADGGTILLVEPFAVVTTLLLSVPAAPGVMVTALLDTGPELVPTPLSSLSTLLFGDEVVAISRVLT